VRGAHVRLNDPFGHAPRDAPDSAEALFNGTGDKTDEK
jgi:hypothetical protein